MRHDHELAAPSIEQRARRRVAMKMGFYTHTLVFALVNTGLYLASTLGGWGNGWGEWRGGHSIFPLWGWALGLAIHGIVVFLKLRGDGLGQRMVEREIEALKRRDGRAADQGG